MKVLKWIGIVVLVLVVVIVGWGLIEPRLLLDREDLQAEIPNLPESWHGKKVAFLADLQVGMWLDNTGMIERVVNEVIEVDPELVLIGGDFVYRPDEKVITEAVNLVRPLADGNRRVIAVLGNHDYSLMKEDAELRADIAEMLEVELERAGIEVLENESVDLGGSFYITGIGSAWAERSQPRNALLGVPDDAARIVVMHNPIVFRELLPHSAPLALAGHTHGGQIRFPGLPSQSWLDIAKRREVIADGWGQSDIGAPGNRIYVNRGIGFSRIPVRFRCRPELNFFTLMPGGETVPQRHPDDDGEADPV